MKPSRARLPRPRLVLRLVATMAALLATTGCFGGGDTEAGAAVERLRDALVTSDAAALRDLVADRSSSARLDLLTDEIVADNEFAGQDVVIDADIERFNGFARFELSTDRDPSRTMRISLSISETATPGALRSVTVTADQDLTELIVAGHRTALEPADRDATRPSIFWLPPGTWKITVPSTSFATYTPQTFDTFEDTVSNGLRFDAALTPAGRAEAIDQAEEYATDCSRTQTDPVNSCGTGGTTVCVGQDTRRSIVYSATPRWTVTDDLRLTTQKGLRSTVTTTCIDRDTGDPDLAEQSTREGAAELEGTVRPTATALTVQLP